MMTGSLLIFSPLKIKWLLRQSVTQKQHLVATKNKLAFRNQSGSLIGINASQNSQRWVFQICASVPSSRAMQMSWLGLHLKDWVMADAWPPQWTQRNLARRFMKPIPFPAWSRQSLEYMRDFCFPNSDELLAPGKLRSSETKDCFQTFAGYHEIPPSKMKQRD
jgi:hypothetical protein